MVTSPFTRKFLILLAFVVCIFYLAYRVLYTFNDSGPYAMTVSILLYVAECWGIFNLFLFFLQVWDVSEPPVQPVLEGRSVDVFVPTFNEDTALLRATLEACVRMDYPHKTYVLDDGRRPEVEALARELGINYISRDDNRHFKAGNLNNAFERTDGEFVVVLDADHVPEPHFITRLIGYFRDDRLGYVQTPHAFYNFDSFQARLDHSNRKYWEEGHLFYYVIQPGRNHWGCPIFAGSAAMFRRAAIRDVGLIATETITEDLHTGLRMNAKGWRSLAITERLVAGQAAPDITTFHSQRLRWGTGNLSVLKYDNPLTIRGLSLPQRLCYLGSMLHWASGIFKLIIYLTPVAMLFSGIPPVREFTFQLLGVTLIYLLVSLTALKMVSNGWGSIINAELFSMVNFWTQIKSTFRAFFGYGSRIFNVTPKGAQAVRSRQQKSVWPFIRPQTYLIILSVLALFWGWGKLLFDGQLLLDKYPNLVEVPVVGWLLKHAPSVGFGISDDYFKPVVPTIWVLLHFWLAYKVTQRAFWPADRRFTTRHVVHVPVEYESAGAAKYGVTVDLNDTGMALVAYERFAAGDILRFTLRGAGEVIRCKGEIRTVTDLTRGQQADGFRYGIQFLNLTPPQADALNRICLHYGVPRMYSQFDANRGGVLGSFKRWQDRGMSQRRGEFRNRFQLPIIVNHGATEDTAQFAATEDITRTAVAALLDTSLPDNAPVGFLMASPLGEVRGTGRVMRASPEQYGGRTYYRTVVEFKDFDGQGRTTLNSLANPEEAGPLKDALRPDRKPTLVKMAGATLAAVLIAIPLIVLQSYIFQYYHSEDRVLRDIAARYKGSKEPLSQADAKALQDIYDKTMDPTKSPTSDRLVLLMAALEVDRAGQEQRRQDRLKVAEKLADLNNQDPGLRQALVYANLNAGRTLDAEATYKNLSERMARGEKLRNVDAAQLQLSGARVADARGESILAVQRYKELYDQVPANYTPPEGKDAVPLRREYAGVLIKAGLKDPEYFERAKKVLEDASPEDTESRRLLIAAHLLKGRSVAGDQNLSDVQRTEAERKEYDAAEAAAQSLSLYADRNNKGELKSTAEQMKIDIQMARQHWDNARKLTDKLVEGAGGDKSQISPELLRRLSQVQLNQGFYPEALDGFSTLLEKNAVTGTSRTEVVKGFIDTAARDKVPTGARETAIAGKLAEEAEATLGRDPVYLARLAWVLEKVKKPTEARQVLELALKEQPNNPTLQTQMAGLYVQSGNPDKAVEYLSKSNAFAAKEVLAGVQIQAGNYGAAAETLNAVLTAYRPGSKNAAGEVIVTEEKYRDIERLRGKVLGLRALQTGEKDPERAANFRAAIDYYETLDRKYPNDKDIPAYIGHVHLWAAGRADNPTDKSESYSAALKRFTDVLSKKNWSTLPDPENLATRSKVEQGFIDAASGAPAIDAAQSTLAREIAERRLAAPGADAMTGTRLAWVLSKSEDKDSRALASDLLKKALASNPTKEEDRREIANVLAAAKDYRAAADVLLPLKKNTADAFKLADLFAGARQWDLAKAQLNGIIGEAGAKPEEVKRAKKDLAKVHAYNGGPTEYAASLKLLDELVKADPEDLSQRLLQAEVNVWSKNFDQALALYTAILKQHPNNTAAAGGFVNAASKVRNPLTDEMLGLVYRVTDLATDPANKDALLTARLGEVYASKIDPVKGRQFALKAFQMDPKEAAVRKEVGYVLANPQVGLFKEADQLLSTSELEGEERKYYVFVASQAENYEAARRQARIYLSEQLPGSLKEREARRLLADVLTWKGDYEEALSIYERLLEAARKDRDLRVNIAEVNRFWQNYPTALQKYAELLSEEFENAQLWIGFIDAASSAQPDRRIEPHKELLMRVHDRYAASITDSRRLSRLAWVMLRLGEPAKANALLDRAVASNPQQPAVRKELAGVLAAAERRPEAIAMLTPDAVMETLDIKELLNLADLLTAESQLDRAEKELARVVTDKSEKKYRVRYASVLLWNGKYAKAQEVLSKLQADFPDDREIGLRIAQSYLWSKDYTTALAKYTDLIAKSPTKEEPLADPEIWRGFIDAAAGAAGESLREFPRKTLGPMFSANQRDLIFKAYNFIPTVQAKTTLENKAELDQANTRGAITDAKRKALEAKHNGRMKGLAESMGRLGLLLGMLGDRARSDGAFGAALAIDKGNRDVWLQYAQTLTTLGDDTKAKAVFDWLISNPGAKLPTPNQ